MLYAVCYKLSPYHNSAIDSKIYTLPRASKISICQNNCTTLYMCQNLQCYLQLLNNSAIAHFEDVLTREYVYKMFCNFIE